MPCSSGSSPLPRTCSSAISVCWHLDGNHKLIRYRIAIHAGMDGATRMSVFAAASGNNNNAATDLRHFAAATAEYGAPSRIRVDRGVRNLFMQLARGFERSSSIRGRSCHNQRIELSQPENRASVGRRLERRDQRLLPAAHVPRINSLIHQMTLTSGWRTRCSCHASTATCACCVLSGMCPRRRKPFTSDRLTICFC